MSRIKKIARRTFLLGSAAIAGGTLFGVWKYKRPFENPLQKNISAGGAVLTPYLRIDHDGISIITPRAEMGQGVHTTLAALVAEELDVDLDNVNIDHGPASSAYFNEVILEEGLPFAATDLSSSAERARGLTHIPAKFLGLQVTGGSSSTPDAFIKMRKAGAAARDVILRAAAQSLNVDASTLRTRNGQVISDTGEQLSYVELAPLLSQFDLKDDPPLKPQSEWRLLGKSQTRVDTAAKSDGTAEYSIDVRLPGMLHAAVMRNPHLGGALLSYDASKAEALPGVKRVLALDDGVVVVATNTWLAFNALQTIDVEWAKASYPDTTPDHFLELEKAFSDEPDSEFRDDGDVDNAWQEESVVSGEYRVPYLAHATMEPMNAVALFDAGKLSVWAGNQLPTQILKDGADIAAISEDDVTVHTTYMGGGFGRRSELDFVKVAMQVAVAMPGTPVKTTWSREEDTRHDYCRPLAIAKFSSQLANDKISALSLDLCAPSIMESQFGRLDLPAIGPDISIVQSAWDQPYRIPHYRVRGFRAPALLPVSSWRSVGASQNGFFHDCVIDEMAHAAAQDPLQFRLAMMNDAPSRAVLKAVAEMSLWGSPLPKGHARGVAFVLSFGVPVAEVVEVYDSEHGIQIVNAWAAVDVGTALDPSNIEAQVESGILFGLAAAISGEITVSDGSVEQSNFHDYPVLRMSQAPEIKVRVLENGEKIRGIGEPGTPPAAPALANAIFAATGKRIRELPLSKTVKFR